MKVGTIESPEEIEDERTERRPVSGTRGGPRGGGGRGPGGGGGGPGDDPSQPPSSHQPGFVPGKSRILTGFLLLVVMMTFGGLLAAYVVIATNRAAEWRPFELPIQVWISTALILIGSLTFHFGKLACDRGSIDKAKSWFIATTVVGAAFISSQLVSWILLRSQGLYMHGNPYAGFFYILTAVHAVHIVGGMAALGSLVLRTWKPAGSADSLAKTQTLAQVVGWYWHFMAILWIVIFVLLGFWK